MRDSRAYILGIREGSVIAVRDLEYVKFDERFDMHVCRYTDNAAVTVKAKGKLWSHLAESISVVERWLSSDEGEVALVELEKRIGRIVE